jgi:TolA-binding protein
MNKAKGYLLLILMGITLYSWAVEPEVTELQPWHNKTTTAASQQNGPANLTLQLLQQVRGLQQQVQQLQGRVDEQAYQLKQLQQRQQTALQDIYQQLPGATSQPDDNSPAITINASPAADLTKPSITPPVAPTAPN